MLARLGTLLLLALATPLPSLTQATPASDLTAEKLVDQLVANAAQYHTNLPSLTASEAILSDHSVLGFKRHAEAQATFRALQNPTTPRLDESRQITVLNGKPVPPDQHPQLPFTLFGGFGRFQDMFFAPNRRPCFTFTLAPQASPTASIELRITPSPAIATMPECEAGLQGLTGVARIDPVSHQLTHLERTIPAEAASRSNHASFASVDSAPTQIGDQTFWLPTVVVGRMNSGKMKGQFTAHYTNYRRFTSTATILPINPE